MGLYQFGGLFLIEIKDRVDYGFGFHEYGNIGLESFILVGISLQLADYIYLKFDKKAKRQTRENKFALIEKTISQKN